MMPRSWEQPLGLGWQVIPLNPRAKTPAVKGWQQCRPDADALARHAAIGGNIGIVTGVASGVIVLDLDSPDAIAEAKWRGLQPTIAAQTGKGLHLYYQHPGGKVTNRAGILPGMDIRGDGGFVVAPESIHPSGARYSWIIAPGDRPLASVPDWLAYLLTRPARAQGVKHPVTRLSTWHRSIRGQSCRDPRELLERIAQAIRCAPCGQQEKTLNDSAFLIGRLVAGDELDPVTARNKLIEAGSAMSSHDLDRPWTVATVIDKIDRALAAGGAA